MKSNKAMQ